MSHNTNHEPLLIVTKKFNQSPISEVSQMSNEIQTYALPKVKDTFSQSTISESDETQNHLSPLMKEEINQFTIAKFCNMSNETQNQSATIAKINKEIDIATISKKIRTQNSKKKTQKSNFKNKCKKTKASDITCHENLQGVSSGKLPVIQPNLQNIIPSQLPLALFWLIVKPLANMVISEDSNIEESTILRELTKQLNMDCIAIWNNIKGQVLTKLKYLMYSDDYKSEMSAHDWLVFDMVLVHQDYAVIEMDNATKEDKKMYVDLFNLVKKFHIESLEGDELAHAWSAVTLSYNNKSRLCTPMLLQSRWYQLKLATRTRFFSYWWVYDGDVTNVAKAESYVPTPLQAAIADSCKSLLLEPFMSWKQMIKKKRIILREQFQRIALERKIKRTVNINDPQNVKVLDSNDGPSALMNDKTENTRHFAEENNFEHEVPIMDIDIEESINKSFIPKNSETMLPKIKYVFGNVKHIPNETLVEIGDFFEKGAPDKKNGAMGAVSDKTTINISIDDAPDVDNCAVVSVVTHNNLNKSFSDVEITAAKRFDNENGETEMAYDSANTTEAVKKIGVDVPGFDRKYFNSEVAEVKVEVKHTGVVTLPLINNNLIDRISEEYLIDVTNTKSDPDITQTKKPTEFTAGSILKTLLTRQLLQKSKNRVYSREQLAKNPDFNLQLKKLPKSFCRKRKNRLLLKMIKPLTVDVSKEFETALVDGRMYLNTDNIYQQNKKKQTLEIKDLTVNSNISGESSSSLNRECTKRNRKRKPRYNKKLKDKSKDDNKNKPKQMCCWAREKASRSESELVNIKHNCPLPLCFCCCREKYSEYISNKNDETTAMAKNTEFTQSLGTSNVSHSKSETAHVDFERNNIDADQDQSFALRDHINQVENMIFLTTIQFPPDLNASNIQHLLDRRKVFKGKAHNKKIYNMVIKMASIPSEANASSIMYVDSSNETNNIFTDLKVTTSAKKINSATLLEQLSKLPLNPQRSESLLFDSIRRSLGQFLSTMLKPVTSVSELLYSYLLNGLFFALDLNTDSLNPVNICL